MKTMMTFLLRILGAVGVAIVFYAMLAGPALLLGDGSPEPTAVLRHQASR